MERGKWLPQCDPLCRIDCIMECLYASGPHPLISAWKTLSLGNGMASFPMSSGFCSNVTLSKGLSTALSKIAFPFHHHFLFPSLLYSSSEHALGSIMCLIY